MRSVVIPVHLRNRLRIFFHNNGGETVLGNLLTWRF